MYSHSKVYRSESRSTYRKSDVPVSFRCFFSTVVSPSISESDVLKMCSYDSNLTVAPYPEQCSSGQWRPISSFRWTDRETVALHSPTVIKKETRARDTGKMIVCMYFYLICVLLCCSHLLRMLSTRFLITSISYYRGMGVYILIHLFCFWKSTVSDI